MPLPIINRAKAPSDVFGATAGADCIKLFTLVTAGFSRDRKIDFLVIIPAYLPFSSRTARTGGKPFLKLSMHLDRVSVSLTELNFSVRISFAVTEMVINNSRKI